jgi:translation initiation factor 1 (eIF-1/SUI1)
MQFEEENFNHTIEIWVETRGRKSDTYISGWNINEDEQKEHLKSIKKKRGCNGSIKEIDKGSGKMKIMQFQGDIKTYVHDYLIGLGISEENIKIKI